MICGILLKPVTIMQTTLNKNSVPSLVIVVLLSSVFTSVDSCRHDSQVGTNASLTQAAAGCIGNSCWEQQDLLVDDSKWLHLKGDSGNVWQMLQAQGMCLA